MYDTSVHIVSITNLSHFFVTVISTIGTKHQGCELITPGGCDLCDLRFTPPKRGLLGQVF